MKPFRDHFSGHARDYARFRPGYPKALFDWLARESPARRRAWDCATGNGQAAQALAEHFTEVIATDASEEQIRAAPQNRANIHWTVASAEDPGLENEDLDLITVAQSLHWFDHPAFFRQTQQRLRPGGLLAIWTYNLAWVNPRVDRAVRYLYHDIVGSFWPAERALVESGYAGLRLPFPEITAPPFRMQADWRLEEFTCYLRTWSGCQRYQAQYGDDPVEQITETLRRAWPNPEQRQTVEWPLALRVAQKPRD